MARQFDGSLPVVWVVGVGERAAYEAYGAARVVEGGGLTQSRNVAIELAAREGCTHVVQVSDDINDIRRVDEPAPISVEQAARALASDLASRELALGGAFPVANPFYARKAARFSLNNFVVGDFIVVDTSTRARFDTRLRVKEDYDYTMQHLKLHGGALRDNHLMVRASHRKNAGGAVGNDRPEHERAAIRLLKAKWGASIRDHPRRALEVVLRHRA